MHTCMIQWILDNKTPHQDLQSGLKRALVLKARHKYI